MVATEKVRFTLRLTGADAFTGTLTDEIRDNQDNVVFFGPGAIQASRITVEAP